MSVADSPAVVPGTLYHWSRHEAHESILASGLVDDMPSWETQGARSVDVCLSERPGIGWRVSGGNRAGDHEVWDLWQIHTVFDTEAFWQPIAFEWRISHVPKEFVLFIDSFTTSTQVGRGRAGAVLID